MTRKLVWPSIAALWACLACNEPVVQDPQLRHAMRSEGALVRGETLFIRYCSICHGKKGDGRGQRRAALSSSAASFIDPSFQKRITPERALEVVREGKRGSSMPAFRWMDEPDLMALIAYVWSLGG